MPTTDPPPDHPFPPTPGTPRTSCTWLTDNEPTELASVPPMSNQTGMHIRYLALDASGHIRDARRSLERR